MGNEALGGTVEKLSPVNAMVNDAGLAITSQEEERRNVHQNLKPSELHKSCEWNGATWWYCGKGTGGKCNGMYRCHKPKSCRRKALKETKTDD